MPADFWAVAEFLGFVVAAALFVFGVWKLDVRLLAAGATVAGIAWLGIAFTTAGEWRRPDLITLHLRPVDAIRRELVADAVVHGIERSDTGPSARYRLPIRLEEPSDQNAPDLAVSLVVELQIKGTLVEQYNNPIAYIQIVDEALEITAPGYRPWRGSVTELLPSGWPRRKPEGPIAIELQCDTN
jgi:hypothetical protein